MTQTENTIKYRYLKIISDIQRGVLIFLESRSKGQRLIKLEAWTSTGEGGIFSFQIENKQTNTFTFNSFLCLTTNMVKLLEQELKPLGILSKLIDDLIGGGGRGLKPQTLA